MAINAFTSAKRANGGMQSDPESEVCSHELREVVSGVFTLDVRFSCHADPYRRFQIPVNPHWQIAMFRIVTDDQQPRDGGTDTDTHLAYTDTHLAYADTHCASVSDRTIRLPGDQDMNTVDSVYFQGRRAQAPYRGNGRAPRAAYSEPPP